MKISAAPICLYLFLILLGAGCAQYNEDSTNKPYSLTEEKISSDATVPRSLAKPAKNTLYSCNFDKLEQSLNHPWLDADGSIHMDEKPVVSGTVSWIGTVTIDVKDKKRIIRSNGLPGHFTGDFPADKNSDAYKYDLNPNSISEQDLTYAIPADPVIADQPACVPTGIIGLALDGAVFFNPLDAEARNAVANEIFDTCEGHPQQEGLYHYHHLSPCLYDDDPTQASPLIGYALDGFGIYGPREEGGKMLTNADLDECHGRIGKDGVYRYHVNNEFPYTLGCFKGEVD